MLLQTDGVAKGLPANAAAERSGSAVRTPDVDLQPVRGGEHLKHNWFFNDSMSATSWMFHKFSGFNLLIRVSGALKLMKYVTIQNVEMSVGAFGALPFSHGLIINLNLYYSSYSA